MPQSQPLRLFCAILMFLDVASSVRIMPLGDSITTGCWRALLYRRLQAVNSDIDFVGNVTGADCGFEYDRNHEGHSGFLATRIARNNLLPQWLQLANPDIVIMHLGTNDILHTLDVNTTSILSAYTKLVQQMREHNQLMKILIAQIIPMGNRNRSDFGPRVLELNANIPSWAANLNEQYSPIIVVDQYTDFDLAVDTRDGIHPSNLGAFTKISDKWFDALTLVINTNDTSLPRNTTNQIPLTNSPIISPTTNPSLIPTTNPSLIPTTNPSLIPSSAELRLNISIFAYYLSFIILHYFY